MRFDSKARTDARRDTALVSSGLIDSMALVDLLLKLEEITHRAYSAGKSTTKRREYGGPDVARHNEWENHASRLLLLLSICHIMHFTHASKPQNDFYFAKVK